MPLNKFPKRIRRGLSSALDRVRWLMASRSELRSDRALDLSVLEDRVLLSAAPAVAVAAPAPQTVDVAVLEPAGANEGVPVVVADAGAVEVAVADARLVERSPSLTLRVSEVKVEVAFVDAGAADYQTLVDDLATQREAGRNIDVIVLDATRDGIEQITEALTRYRDVDAVHLVSHATDRGVKLGSSWLTLDSLPGNAGRIANWGWALSSDADVLFYGCDLAASADGRELLESIGALTGADVAASDDDTGNARLGGDWELEFRAGDVAEATLFSSELQVDWDGLLNTFVVTSTANSGAGSLRQAIIDANALAGLDTITFNIGSGVQTIALTSELPDIIDVLVIDGSTQPGFTTSPLIELDGRLAGAGANGLTLQSNITVKALSIFGFSGYGVEILGDSNVVSGNFIGTNVAGAGGLGNQLGGVLIENGRFNRLGGLVAGAGNVISGNDGSGVFVRGATAENNQIFGNLIGTAADGSTALGNNGHGIVITDGAFTSEVGNGTAAGSNTIRFNAGHGVLITDGSGSTIFNAVRVNSISDNGGLGIDLGNDGVDGSDLADGDLGPNNRQNAPVITNVLTSATNTTIYGRLNGIVTTNYQIDLFSSPTADPSGYGEGQTFLGTVSVTTDGNNGDAYFQITIGTVLAANSVVTATATSQGGDTSEFSAANPPDSYVLLNPQGETLINGSVANVQQTSGDTRGSTNAVAIAADGTYFVVWSEQPSAQNWRVMLRRYDSNGSALTGPIQVSAVGGTDSQWATVAVDAFGRAVVTWTQVNSGNDVYARQIQADGSMNGVEFRVNTQTANIQQHSSVAVDLSGNFVIAWEGEGPGDAVGVFARRYLADGTALGNEFLVNTTTLGIQGDPTVAMNGSGQFVIVWNDIFGVHGQRYDAVGTALGSQFTVDADSSASESSVAVASDGRFVVVFRKSSFFSGLGVYARRYDAAGVAQNVIPFLVNTDTSGDQINPSVTMDSTGNFIVVFEGVGGADATGVYARRFDASGVDQGNSFLVNATTSGTQEMVSVAMQDLDNYVVVWSGNGPGDTNGVFSRQYGTVVVNQPPTITSNGGGVTATVSIAENTTAVTTVTATDADLPAQTLTYSINGGVDAGKFTINSSTGALRFIAAPNFESPTDAGGNNVYNVTVEVADGVGGVDSQAIAVSVTGVNDNTPALTSNGGGANATVGIAENMTAVTTVTATDADLPGQTLTFTINGGADAGKFTINGSTGVLSFLTAPDFETPTDVGGNNVYDVIVRVSDGALFDSQAIAVSVTDVGGTLVVDTFNDVVDGNTSSVEALLGSRGADGFISLREAILAANNTAGADSIQLAAGTYTLTMAGQGEDLSATGDLDITDSVNIVGAGIGVSQIDANGLDRVFQIHAGTVSMSDLTIRGGVVAASDWGAGFRIQNVATLNLSRVEVTNNSAGSGAGIYNYGTLTTTDSIIRNNSASDWGGGLYNDRGNVTLNRVTISGNTAGKDGGGIENSGAGAVMSLVNVTLSGNTATGNGGGLWNNRAVTATNVTIAFNTAAAGDGLYGQGGGGTISLKNSVLFNPAGSNSNKAMTSLGHNLDSDGSAGLADPTDFNNVDPLLDTLQANGGFGATHALLSGSAAINGGTSSGAPSVDQRNVARDASPDIGAFEFVFVGNVPPVITSNGGGNTASLSVAENSTSVTTVTATDPDLPAQSLTFTISGGADAGLFTIDGSTGVLSFATAPNFEQPTDADSDNVYDVTVHVSDGSLVDVQTIAVTVTNVNEAPIAVANSYSVNEDGTLNISASGVLSNDTDPDTNPLTAVLVANVSSGSLSLNANGSFTYTPNANFNGNDSFTYSANDGSLNSNLVTVTITVNPINDAPTVSVSGSTLSYSEQAAPLTIDSGLTVNDVDGDDLTGATVTITGGLLSGPDELLFTLSGGISGAFDAATDTLTLSGTANAGNYQAVLRSVQFRNLSDTPFVSTRTLTFSVTDGVLTSSDSRNVNVTAINDSPTIAVANPDLTFVEGGAELIIDSGLTVSDVDNTQLTGATVRISANFHAGEDVLTISNSGPISSSYNSATGVLTLTGSQSLSEYRDALRTVAYRNTNGSPNTSPRTILFSINDGAATGTDSRVVQISAVNSSPTMNQATFSLAENSANGTLVGVATATDPDVGDTKSFAITAGNTGGAFAINATTGQITVATSSAVNFETTPSFALTVQVTDGGGLQDTDVVTINLTNVNEAPVITSNGAGANAAITVAENGTAVTTATATDVDLPAQPLTFSISGGADSGKFAINSTTGVLTFLTAPNFEVPTDVGANNVYNVNVRVTDGTLTDTQNLAITVTNVNEAPVITSNGGGATANISRAENTTTVTTVVATDPDAGATQNYSITGGADAGLFVINTTTGALSFAAAPNFETPTDAGGNNIYDVTVQVSDGTLTDSQIVAVTITNANEAPNMTPATFSLAENSANGTVVGSATATDPDAGDTRTFAITGGNVAGAFAINAATGEITVANSAAVNFETTPTFNLTVRVTDGGGLQNAKALTINLTNVNEAPTVNSATFGIAEHAANGTAIGSVVATDPDSGDTRNFAITGGNVAGAFAINTATGQITVANSAALDLAINPIFSLTVQLTDGGGLPASNTITVNLFNGNQAPTMNPASFGLVENSANGTVVGSATATDPDLGDSLNFAIVGGNIGGAFAIDSASGQITIVNSTAVNFEANPVFNLIVRATDTGGLADTATIQINLSNVNEAPTLSNATTSLEQTSANGTSVVDLNAFDPDAADLSTFAILSGNLGGTFAINPLTGRIVVADNSQLNAATTPTYTLVVHVQDSFGLSDTATVTINMTYTPPIVAPPPPSGSGGGSSGSDNNGGGTPPAGNGNGTGSGTGSGVSAGNITPPLVLAGPPSGTSGQSSNKSNSTPDNVPAPPGSSSIASATDDAKGNGALLVTGESLIRKTATERQPDFRAATAGESSTANALINPATTSESSFRESLRFGNEDLGFLVDRQYLTELKNVENKLDDAPITPQWVTGSAAATTTGLSIGYILWLLRSGYLVTSVLTTLPMWQSVDPLPILSQLDEDEDDESLDEMIGRAEQESEERETMKVEI